VAAILNAALLLVWLRPRLGGLEGRRNARAVAAVILASAAMAVAVWFTQHTLEAVIVGRSTLARALRVFTSIAVGIMVLTAAARILRIEEFNQALGRATSRITGGLSSD
jgi:peptidoglycan biosynthesis protein MviN/MurJ (putative lipid II flippase)